MPSGAAASSWLRSLRPTVGNWRQPAGATVAVDGLMAHAEGRGDLAQALTGSEQVGRQLALGGVLEDGAFAGGGPGRDVVQALAPVCDRTGDGAQAEAVGAGEFGGGGGAEIDEHGDGLVAVEDRGEWVGKDNVEVMEIEQRVAADAHGEAGIDGDGAGGEQVEGDLCGAGSGAGGRDHGIDRDSVHMTQTSRHRPTYI